MAKVIGLAHRLPAPSGRPSQTWANCPRRCRWEAWEVTPEVVGQSRQSHLTLHGTWHLGKVPS